jgi:endonuclease III
MLLLLGSCSWMQRRADLEKKKVDLEAESADLLAVINSTEATDEEKAVASERLEKVNAKIEAVKKDAEELSEKIDDAGSFGDTAKVLVLLLGAIFGVPAVAAGVSKGIDLVVPKKGE